MLIPISLTPYIFGFTGITASIVILVLGVMFSIPSFQLFLTMKDTHAKKLMFASFLYLPFILLAFFFDKIM
jgi:protoheme IX farnesyltransferase